MPEAARRQHARAIARLRELLPTGWTVAAGSRASQDRVVVVSSDGDEGTLTVVALKRLEPRDVPGLPDDDGPVVVTSPWVSPRTRELLRARGFGYLDNTGNTEITMNRPGLVIRTEGADRDPNPRPVTGPTLRGPRAWALLRTLVEVAPPYGVQDLSDALRVDAGYVSRVLKVLADELLIERSPRGPVTSVDWEGTLRKLASTYSLFESNETSTWVASSGAGQLVQDLLDKRAGPWAVTGSFASARIVPVAAPETAVIYTTDAERLAKVGQLLPATAGANVVLAVPYDEIVFDRTQESATVPYVSTAQAAVDDLTGNGRMPEEGEALVEWMRRNPSRWQASMLTSPTTAS